MNPVMSARGVAVAAVVLTFAAVAFAGSSAPTGRVQAATSLANEVLTGTSLTLSGGVCNPSGSSILTFTAMGNANGPLPGTFTETIALTLDSPGGPASVLATSFTIVSGETTVTGTKQLAVPALPATCDPDGRVQLANPAPLTYATADDIGTGTVELNYASDVPGAFVFREVFLTSSLSGDTPTATPTDTPAPTVDATSTPTVTVPSAPTTKEQCKDGGWRRYGFKNQGDCIRSIDGGR
jgi:hypothetical protein